MHVRGCDLCGFNLCLQSARLQPLGLQLGRREGAGTGALRPVLGMGAQGGTIGELVQLYVEPRVFPGAYALAGAAGMLGGVQRATISLVVIMIEVRRACSRRAQHRARASAGQALQAPQQGPTRKTLRNFKVLPSSFLRPNLEDFNKPRGASNFWEVMLPCCCRAPATCTRYSRW